MLIAEEISKMIIHKSNRLNIEKEATTSLYSTLSRSKVSSIIAITFIFIFLLSLRVCAEEVLFIETSSGGSSIEKMQVELACRFYGIDYHSFSLNKKELGKILPVIIEKSNAKALIITAEALSELDQNEIFAAAAKGRVFLRKFLVLNITDATMNSRLTDFSNGIIKGCNRLTDIEEDAIYMISDNQKNVTLELAGQEYKSQVKDNFYLVFDKKPNVQTIMNIRKDDKLFPNFIRINLEGKDMFFQTNISSSSPSGKISWKDYKDHFIEIAPLMMFLRYSLGDCCWHRNEDYANFIIDDPWLREPYGFLSYSELLKEMEKANFHTTIAFIPWNYDRSDPHIIELFQKNPHRLSICIHGNNHDHEEFLPPKKLQNDGWPKIILQKQAEDIKQAIARMEQFKKLTGIPYDRIMVFPHGSFGEKTLGLLKKYNIWATVNGNNIPLGSSNLQDEEFFMRPGTLNYSNFLSIRRYQTNTINKSDIARELFLDNPVVFYEHHDYFKAGINEFNKIAATINQIQGKVKWSSIGDVVRHMYLQKLRADGDYEILLLSSNILLENNYQKGATFYVRKRESFSPAIKSVMINNKAYHFDSQDDKILMKVFLSPGKSAAIQIEYENDFSNKTIDIEKTDYRVWLLRKLSDFRDVIIARNAIGRKIIDAYYSKREIEELGLVIVVIVIVVPVFLCIFGAIYILKRYRKKHL